MKLVSIILVIMHVLTQHISALPFLQETDKFNIFCLDTDRGVIEDIIRENEIFHKQLSQDFNHYYSSKIMLHIYPDLASLHEAINWPDAPDWVIGHNGKNIIRTVSPNNPGPAHTYLSVMKSMKVGLVSLFIYDKYHNHHAIPRWLHQGVGLYKARFFSNNSNEKLAKNISILPTLIQLENVEKNNTTLFDSLNGFRVSCAMVEFIDHIWGWHAILDLLEDYARFERILNIDKETFTQKWITYLQKYLP